LLDKFNFYFSPRFYEFVLSIVHGKNFERRYKVISRKIGKRKKVLEVGCGTCELSKFIDESNTYYGLDLNRKFMDYGKGKREGINLIHGNIFELKKYPKADVIVAVDLLHHIFPKHEFLLRNLLRKSKEIIVCEPFGETMAPYFDFDGVNPNSSKRGPLGWKGKFKTKKNLVDFFKSNGAKETIKIGKDIIAVFKR